MDNMNNDNNPLGQNPVPRVNFIASVIEGGFDPQILSDIYNESSQLGSEPFIMGDNDIISRYPNLNYTQEGLSEQEAAQRKVGFDNVKQATGVFWQAYQDNKFDRNDTSRPLFGDDPVGKRLANRYGGIVTTPQTAAWTIGDPTMLYYGGVYADRVQTEAQRAHSFGLYMGNDGQVKEYKGSGANVKWAYDEEAGDYYMKELEENEYSDPATLISAFGPPKIKGTTAGAFARGTFSGAVGKTIKGTGALIEVIGDITGDNDDPNAWHNRVGRKSSTLANRLSLVHEREKDSMFSSFNAFMYHFAEGIGQIAMIYGTGGAGFYTTGALTSSKLAAQMVGRAASLSLGSAQAMGMEKEQARQMGIDDTGDLLQWQILGKGIVTGMVESMIGPNRFLTWGRTPQNSIIKAVNEQGKVIKAYNKYGVALATKGSQMTAVKKAYYKTMDAADRAAFNVSGKSSIKQGLVAAGEEYVEEGIENVGYYGLNALYNAASHQWSKGVLNANGKAEYKMEQDPRTGHTIYIKDSGGQEVELTEDVWKAEQDEVADARHRLSDEGTYGLELKDLMSGFGEEGLLAGMSAFTFNMMLAGFGGFKSKTAKDAAESRKNMYATALWASKQTNPNVAIDKVRADLEYMEQQGLFRDDAVDDQGNAVERAVDPNRRSKKYIDTFMDNLSYTVDLIKRYGLDTPEGLNHLDGGKDKGLLAGLLDAYIKYDNAVTVINKDGATEQEVTLAQQELKKAEASIAYYSEPREVAIDGSPTRKKDGKDLSTQAVHKKYMNHRFGDNMAHRMFKEWEEKNPNASKAKKKEKFNELLINNAASINNPLYNYAISEQARIYESYSEVFNRDTDAVMAEVVRVREEAKKARDISREQFDDITTKIANSYSTDEKGNKVTDKKALEAAFNELSNIVSESTMMSDESYNRLSTLYQEHFQAYEDALARVQNFQQARSDIKQSIDPEFDRQELNKYPEGFISEALDDDSVYSDDTPINDLLKKYGSHFGITEQDVNDLELASRIANQRILDRPAVADKALQDEFLKEMVVNVVTSGLAHEITRDENNTSPIEEVKKEIIDGVRDTLNIILDSYDSIGGSEGLAAAETFDLKVNPAIAVYLMDALRNTMEYMRLQHDVAQDIEKDDKYSEHVYDLSTNKTRLTKEQYDANMASLLKMQNAVSEVSQKISAINEEKRQDKTFQISRHLGIVIELNNAYLNGSLNPLILEKINLIQDQAKKEKLLKLWESLSAENVKLTNSLEGKYVTDEESKNAVSWWQKMQDKLDSIENADALNAEYTKIFEEYYKPLVDIMGQMHTVLSEINTDSLAYIIREKVGADSRGMRFDNILVNEVYDPHVFRTLGNGVAAARQTDTRAFIYNALMSHLSMIRGADIKKYIDIIYPLAKKMHAQQDNVPIMEQVMSAAFVYAYIKSGIIIPARSLDPKDELSSPIMQNAISLLGSGGVGKTSMVPYLSVALFEGKDIIFLTPNQDRTPEILEYFRDFPVQVMTHGEFLSSDKINSNAVVFIDEATALSKAWHQSYTQIATTKGLKSIMIGDNQQSRPTVLPGETPLLEDRSANVLLANFMMITSHRSSFNEHAVLANYFKDVMNLRDGTNFPNINYYQDEKGLTFGAKYYQNKDAIENAYVEFLINHPDIRGDEHVFIVRKENDVRNMEEKLNTRLQGVKNKAGVDIKANVKSVEFDGMSINSNTQSGMQFFHVYSNVDAVDYTGGIHNDKQLKNATNALYTIVTRAIASIHIIGDTTKSRKVDKYALAGINSYVEKYENSENTSKIRDSYRTQNLNELRAISSKTEDSAEVVVEGAMDSPLVEPGVLAKDQLILNTIANVNNTTSIHTNKERKADERPMNVDEMFKFRNRLFALLLRKTFMQEGYSQEAIDEKINLTIQELNAQLENLKQTTIDNPAAFIATIIDRLENSTLYDHLSDQGLTIINPLLRFTDNEAVNPLAIKIVGKTTIDNKEMPIVDIYIARVGANVLGTHSITSAAKIIAAVEAMGMIPNLTYSVTLGTSMQDIKDPQVRLVDRAKINTVHKDLGIDGIKYATEEQLYQLPRIFNYLFEGKLKFDTRFGYRTTEGLAKKHAIPEGEKIRYLMTSKHGNQINYVFKKSDGSLIFIPHGEITQDDIYVQNTTERKHNLSAIMFHGPGAFYSDFMHFPTSSVEINQSFFDLSKNKELREKYVVMHAVRALAGQLRLSVSYDPVKSLAWIKEGKYSGQQDLHHVITLKLRDTNLIKRWIQENSSAIIGDYITKEDVDNVVSSLGNPLLSKPHLTEIAHYHYPEYGYPVGAKRKSYSPDLSGNFDPLFQSYLNDEITVEKLFENAFSETNIEDEYRQDNIELNMARAEMFKRAINGTKKGEVVEFDDVNISSIQVFGIQYAQDKIGLKPVNYTNLAKQGVTGVPKIIIDEETKAPYLVMKRFTDGDVTLPASFLSLAQLKEADMLSGYFQMIKDNMDRFLKANKKDIDKLMAYDLKSANEKEKQKIRELTSKIGVQFDNTFGLDFFTLNHEILTDEDGHILGATGIGQFLELRKVGEGYYFRAKADEDGNRANFRDRVEKVKGAIGVLEQKMSEESVGAVENLKAYINVNDTSTTAWASFIGLDIEYVTQPGLFDTGHKKDESREDLEDNDADKDFYDESLRRELNLTETRDQIELTIAQILGDEFIKGNSFILGSIDPSVSIGQRVLGKVQKGNLYLYADDGKFSSMVARHEAMHYIVNYFLGKTEKIMILEEVKSIMREKMGPGDYTDKAANEYLADMFMVAPEKSSIIQRFFAYVRALLHQLGLYTYSVRSLVIGANLGTFAFERSMGMNLYKKNDEDYTIDDTEIFYKKESETLSEIYDNEYKGNVAAFDIMLHREMYRKLFDKSNLSKSFGQGHNKSMLEIASNAHRDFIDSYNAIKNTVVIINGQSKSIQELTSADVLRIKALKKEEIEDNNKIIYSGEGNIIQEDTLRTNERFNRAYFLTTLLKNKEDSNSYNDRRLIDVMSYVLKYDVGKYLTEAKVGRAARKLAQYERIQGVAPQLTISKKENDQMRPKDNITSLLINTMHSLPTYAYKDGQTLYSGLVLDDKNDRGFMIPDPDSMIRDLQEIALEVKKSKPGLLTTDEFMNEFFNRLRNWHKQVNNPSKRNQLFSFLVHFGDISYRDNRTKILQQKEVANRLGQDYDVINAGYYQIYKEMPFIQDLVNLPFDHNTGRLLIDSIERQVEMNLSDGFTLKDGLYYPNQEGEVISFEKAVEDITTSINDALKEGIKGLNRNLGLSLEYSSTNKIRDSLQKIDNLLLKAQNIQKEIVSPLYNWLNNLTMVTSVTANLSTQNIDKIDHNKIDENKGAIRQRLFSSITINDGTLGLMPNLDMVAGKNRITKGVDFVFELNPELAALGSKEQYSAYLESIFPLGITPVLFKGLRNKSGTVDDTPDHSFYTADKNIAEQWYGTSEGVKSFIFDTRTAEEFKGDQSQGLSVLQKQEEDIINNSKQDFVLLTRNDIGGLQDQYVIKKTIKMHELGSKEDIEGFKKHLKTSLFHRISIGNNGEVIYTPEKNQSTVYDPKGKFVKTEQQKQFVHHVFSKFGLSDYHAEINNLYSSNTPLTIYKESGMSNTYEYSWEKLVQETAMAVYSMQLMQQKTNEQPINETVNNLLNKHYKQRGYSMETLAISEDKKEKFHLITQMYNMMEAIATMESFNEILGDSIVERDLDGNYRQILVTGNKATDVFSRGSQYAIAYFMGKIKDTKTSPLMTNPILEKKIEFREINSHGGVEGTANNAVFKNMSPNDYVDYLVSMFLSDASKSSKYFSYIFDPHAGRPNTPIVKFWFDMQQFFNVARTEDSLSISTGNGILDLYDNVFRYYEKIYALSDSRWKEFSSKYDLKAKKPQERIDEIKKRGLQQKLFNSNLVNTLDYNSKYVDGKWDISIGNVDGSPSQNKITRDSVKKWKKQKAPDRLAFVNELMKKEMLEFGMTLYKRYGKRGLKSGDVDISSAWNKSNYNRVDLSGLIQNNPDKAAMLEAAQTGYWLKVDNEGNFNGLNETWEAYFHAYFVISHAVGTLNRGSALQYKNAADYFKRSAPETTPGMRGNTDANGGIGKEAGISAPMRVVNVRDLPGKHDLIDRVDHELRTNGMNVSMPFVGMMLKASGLGGYMGGSMIKDLLVNMDYNSGTNTQVKKATLFINEYLYKTFSSAKEMVRLQLGERMWNQYKELLDENYSLANELIYNDIINGEASDVAHFIAFGSSVKTGLSKVYEFNPGESDSPIFKENREDVLSQYDWDNYRIVYNPEQDIENARAALASQIRYLIGVGSEANRAINKAIESEIANLSIQETEKITEALSDPDKRNEYLQQIISAVRSQQHSSGKKGMVYDIATGYATMSEQVPLKTIGLLRSAFTTIYNSNLNKKAIRPKLPGSYYSQAALPFMYGYDINGIWHAENEVKNSEGATKRELKPMRFKRKDGSFYTSIDEMRGSKDIIIVPGEVIVEYQYMQEFGVTSEDTLNSIMTFGGINFNGKTSKEIRQEINKMSNEDIVNALSEHEGRKALILKNSKMIGSLEYFKMRMDNINLLSRTKKKTPDLKELKIDAKQITDSLRNQIKAYFENFNESLNLIAVRIPTSGMNLVQWNRIVGFGHGLSSTIITSTEKSILDGSDMDIDQLLVFYQDILSNGYVNRKNFGTKIFNHYRDYFKDGNNFEMLLQTIDMGAYNEFINELMDKESALAIYTPSTSIAFDKIFKDGNDVGYFANMNAFVSKVLHLSPTERKSIVKGMPILYGENEMEYSAQLTLITSHLVNLATDNDKMNGLGVMNIHKMTSNIVLGYILSKDNLNHMDDIRTIVDYLRDPEMMAIYDKILKAHSVNQSYPPELIDELLSKTSETAQEGTKEKMFNELYEWVLKGEQINRLGMILSITNDIPTDNAERYTILNRLASTLGMPVDQAISFLQMDDAAYFDAKKPSIEDQISYLTQNYYRPKAYETRIRESFNYLDALRKFQAARNQYIMLYKQMELMSNTFLSDKIIFDGKIEQKRREFGQEFKNGEWVNESAGARNIIPSTDIMKAVAKEFDKYLLSSFISSKYSKHLFGDKIYNLSLSSERIKFAKDLVEKIRALREVGSNSFLKALKPEYVQDTQEDVLKFISTHGITTANVENFKKDFDAIDEIENGITDQLVVYNLLVYGVTTRKGSTGDLIYDKLVEKGLVKEFEKHSEKVLKDFDKHTDQFFDQVYYHVPDLLSKGKTKRVSRGENKAYSGKLYSTYVLKYDKEANEQQISTPLYRSVVNTYQTDGKVNSVPYPELNGLTKKEIDGIENGIVSLPKRMFIFDTYEAAKRANKHNTIARDYKAVLADGRVVKFTEDVVVDNEKEVSRSNVITVSDNTRIIKPARYNPASKAALEVIREQISKMFPNIAIEFITSDDSNNASPHSIGYVYDGKVFINTDLANYSVLLHEVGGHIVADYIHKYFPMQWNIILDKVNSMIKADDALIQMLKQDKDYASLGSDDFAKEVFATIVGWNGQDRMEVIAQKYGKSAQERRGIISLIKDFIEKFMRYAKLFFSELFGIDVSNNIDDATTFFGLVETVIQKAERGEFISNMSSYDYNVMKEGLVQRMNIPMATDVRSLGNILMDPVSGTPFNALDHSEKVNIAYEFWKNEKTIADFQGVSIELSSDESAAKEQISAMLGKMYNKDDKFWDEVVMYLKANKKDRIAILDTYKGGKKTWMNNVLNHLDKVIDMNQYKQIYRYSDLKGTKFEYLYNEALVGYNPFIVIETDRDGNLSSASLIDINTEISDQGAVGIKKQKLSSVFGNRINNAEGLFNTNKDVRLLSLYLTAMKMKKMNPGVQIKTSGAFFVSEGHTGQYYYMDPTKMRKTILELRDTANFKKHIDSEMLKDLFDNPVDVGDVDYERLLIDHYLRNEQYNFDPNKEYVDPSYTLEYLVRYHKEKGNYPTNEKLALLKQRLIYLASQKDPSADFSREYTLLAQAIMSLERPWRYTEDANVLRDIDKNKKWIAPSFDIGFDYAQILRHQINNASFFSVKKTKEFQDEMLVHVKKFRSELLGKDGASIKEYFSDMGNRYFEPLWVMKDIDGKKAKTGQIYFTTDETKDRLNAKAAQQMINDGNLTREQLDVGQYLVSMITEMMIDMYYHNHVYRTGEWAYVNNQRVRYTREMAAKDMFEKTSYKEGMVPLMYRSAGDYMSRGQIKKGAKKSWEQLSNVYDPLEEAVDLDSGYESLADLEIQDKFFYQFTNSKTLAMGPGGYNTDYGNANRLKLLGLERDNTGAWIMSDVASNENISTNLWSILSSMALNNNRKIEYENRAVPVYNAINRILYDLEAKDINVEEAQDYLSRVNDFVIQAKPLNTKTELLGVNPEKAGLLVTSATASYYMFMNTNVAVLSTVSNGIAAWVEAFANLGYDEGFYGPKELLWATKEFFASPHKAMAINDLYQIMNHEEQNLLNNPTYKPFSKHPFTRHFSNIGNFATDYFARVVVVMAHMKKIGAWDSHVYDKETGKIVFDETLDGRWNDGSDIKKAELANIKKIHHDQGLELRDGKLTMGFDMREITRLKYIGDKYIVGAYGAKQKAMLSTTFIGRMVSLFQVYLTSRLQNAFQKGEYVTEGGWYKTFEKPDENGNMQYVTAWERRYVEGYFRTMFTVYAPRALDAIKNKEKVTEVWNTLNTAQKYNIQKAFTQFTLMLIMLAMAKFIRWPDDDDDEVIKSITISPEGDQVFEDVRVLRNFKYAAQDLWILNSVEQWMTRPFATFDLVGKLYRTIFINNYETTFERVVASAGGLGSSYKAVEPLFKK